MERRGKERKVNYRVIMMPAHISIKVEGEHSQRDTEFIGANWGECCSLLGQIEVCKKRLIEFMDDMKPEWEIKDK